MKINKEKVQIGSDFEMFLKDGSGKTISAIPFNTGTKAIPESLSKKGCCIQRDGVLQECNVPPVGLNGAEEFSENVKLVKDYIYDKFARKQQLQLVCCPSSTLEEDQLIPDEAREFGCSPDFNAWRDAELNVKPNSEGVKLRSCGGHIHISYEGADNDVSIELMKVFDLYLTVPFILLDEDTERRKLYGKAGAFRWCEFGDGAKGFEARTLSNFWVSDDEYIDYVFHQLNEMFDHYNEYGLEKVNKFADKIVDAINSSDKELAKHICEQFDLHFLIEKETEV